MTAPEALARLKRKFGIKQADTSLDADGNDAVAAAIDLLAPYISKPPAANTSVTLTANGSSFSNPVAGSTITKIWAKQTGGVWLQLDRWTQQGDTIYIYDSPNVAVDLKILYVSPYTLAAIADIPLAFTVPLVDFACSEFATYLAGSKTKYDIYQQSNGARGVDNMTALAEFYEGRAINRITDISDAQGVV